MSRLQIDGIVADTFSSDTPRGAAALFLNGFPGAIGPLPGVLHALRLGYDVLFVQYPGTYDSEGTFSVGETVAALSLVLGALADGSATDMVSDVPMTGFPPVTTAIAHSFGAHIFLNLARSGAAAKIERALLLAPVTTYTAVPDSGIREDLLPHVAGVRKSRPHTYRLADDAVWQRVANGVYSVSETSRSWSGRVLGIAGSEDDTFDLDIFADAFPRDVAAATGATDIQLEIVSGAGHGMDEVLGGTRSADSFLAE